MPVDYNILLRAPTIGQGIIEGMRSGREAAIRNQLLARQNQQFEQAQQDRARALQREQQVQGLYRQAADVIRRYGQNPDDPQVLQEGVAQATEAGNMQMAQIFTGMLADAQKRAQDRKYRAEYEQQYGGGAAAKAAAAPAAAVPQTGQMTAQLIDEGQVRRGFEPQPLLGAQPAAVTPPPQVTVRDLPMGRNAMPGAAAPAANALAMPADPLAAQRAEAMEEAMSSNPHIAARGRLRLANMPKLEMPQGDKPMAVSGRLVGSQTGRVIYEPPPAAATPEQKERLRLDQERVRLEGVRADLEQQRIRAQETSNAAAQKRAEEAALRAARALEATERRLQILENKDRRAAEAQTAKTDVQQQARQDLSQELKTVLSYYEKLNNMGAMTDPTRTIDQNVVAYVRSSGLGQEAERAAGSEAQTLRDNISNARQRILSHVKNVTGATSKQMDSNRELQIWLDSLTTPQQSISTVRETLKQIDQVMGSVRDQVAREAQSGGKTAPNAGRVQSLSDDEILRQLGVKPGGR